MFTLLVIQMAVKILVTSVGQQIVSEVKQVENKETKEVIAYWLENPRVVGYQQGEDGQINVNFGAYCLLSDEAAFSIRADYITSILEPREDVVARYTEVTTPPEGAEVSDETVQELKDATESDTAEAPEPVASVAD